MYWWNGARDESKMLGKFRAQTNITITLPLIKKGKISEGGALEEWR